MSVQRQEMLREGKSKILYATNNPDQLIQWFKDDATAFNAQKKGTIQKKGYNNNLISSLLFRYLEKHGIPTHFSRRLSEREMLVRKVEIIPVEVVIRNRAAGSLVKRLGTPKGKSLNPPLVEFFYKDDGLGDPLIGEGHILYFNWATEEELMHMTKAAFDVNLQLVPLFHEVGIDLVDFKLEFGRDSVTKKVLLADEITPDGCRLWDLKTGEPMDKDRFRHDLGKVEEAYDEVCKRLEATLAKHLPMSEDQ